MVRIPALPGRSDAAATQDVKKDGRVGEPDGPATSVSRPAAPPPAPTRTPVVPDRPVTDRTNPPPRPEPAPRPERRLTDHRPRASVLAMLGLVVGVAAMLFVLSGTLAGYGAGLGMLALLLSVGGVSATGTRHVAGKPDALLGLALGLGAVIIGVLALTGQFTWPTMDGDIVERFRQWLDAQTVDRF